MQGTTIEITLWRSIADKFYDHIEEGQVCLFTEYTWVAIFTAAHSGFVIQAGNSTFKSMSTQPYCSVDGVILSQQRHD